MEFGVYSSDILTTGYSANYSAKNIITIIWA